MKTLKTRGGLHTSRIPSFINVTPYDGSFLSVRLYNEDVGVTSESIPLILTYFMIMKGIQRMIMIKVSSPTGCVARQSAVDTE